MRLVSCVWRAGSGAQWVKVSKSWADFKTADTGYFNSGLRLVDFEVEGGKVSVADGWQHGPAQDKGDRWDPAELTPVITTLLAKAPPPTPVYGTSPS